MRPNGLVFLTVALFVVGCGNATRFATERLDSVIDIRVHERFLSSGRALEWECTTQKIYPCYNYGLLIEIVDIPFARSVEFVGIRVPELCLDAFGPATKRIEFGQVRTGDSAFRLAANGSTLHGTMRITPDSIVVIGGDGPWTRFPSPRLLRVPEGSLWGTIGWGPRDQALRAQAFLDSLAALGASVPISQHGDYDVFRVDASGVTIPGDHGYWFERDFALRFDGDPGPLEGLVRDFGDSLSISMFSDRGTAWHSHLLRANP
jgi:hypothetical protein